MTRRIAGAAAVASLVLLAAAPALAFFDRRRPGVALACMVVLGIAATLTAGSRRLRLPEEFLAVLLLPFAAAWGLGEGFGLFAHVRGWDSLCHLVAGGALGVMAAGLSPRSRGGAPVVRALVVALTVGLLWEFGEWSSDRLIASRTFGTVADTRSDLCFDAVGGILGGLAVVVSRRVLPAPERRRLSAGLRRLRDVGP
jgi:hypothetical protein